MTSAEALRKGDQGIGPLSSEAAVHGPSPRMIHVPTPGAGSAAQGCVWAGSTPGWSHPPWSSRRHCWLGTGGWCWPGEPGSAGQGFSKALWHILAVGRRGRGCRAPFSNATTQGCGRGSGMLPAPSLALGAVSFPQVLAGDPMFHALPGQSTFTPTASR